MKLKLIPQRLRLICDSTFNGFIHSFVLFSTSSAKAERKAKKRREKEKLRENQRKAERKSKKTREKNQRFKKAHVPKSMREREGASDFLE